MLKAIGSDVKTELSVDFLSGLIYGDEYFRNVVVVGLKDATVRCYKVEPRLMSIKEANLQKVESDGLVLSRPGNEVSAVLSVNECVVHGNTPNV